MSKLIKLLKLVLLKIVRVFVLGIIFFTFFLDKIFFRNKGKIEKPIFIIGHLRSGTTFLHRFMCDNCTDLKGMMLLDMLLPAITTRKLLKPLIPLLKRMSLDKIYNPKIHETNFFCLKPTILRFISGMPKESSHGYISARGKDTHRLKI